MGCKARAHKKVYTHTHFPYRGAIVSPPNSKVYLQLITSLPDIAKSKFASLPFKDVLLAFEVTHFTLSQSYKCFNNDVTETHLVTANYSHEKYYENYH